MDDLPDAVLVAGCYKDNEQELYTFLETPGSCDTTNVTYSEVVSKIISNNCLVCHGQNNNSAGGSIDLQTTSSVAAIAKK